MAKLMDGAANWRSGGGYDCSEESALTSVAYYLHYGVSPSPPYQKNGGTWHNHHDFDNPEYSSTGAALKAVDRFVSAAPTSSPVIIALSSAMWDLGRFQTLNPSFNNRSYGSERWASDPQIERWLTAYEANYSRLALAVQARLRTSPGPHDRGTRPPRGRDSLLLVADFGCAGPTLMRTMCGVMIPRMAHRVRIVSEHLHLPLVDVSDLGRDFSHGTEAIKREYSYTMHPSKAGSCAIWNAIAKQEPRIPGCNGRNTSCTKPGQCLAHLAVRESRDWCL